MQTHYPEFHPNPAGCFVQFTERLMVIPEADYISYIAQLPEQKRFHIRGVLYSADFMPMQSRRYPRYIDSWKENA